MDLITNVLFWLSNGMLVPDIIFLLFFFVKSLIMIGGFYGAYITRTKVNVKLNRDLEYGAIVQGNTLVVSVYNQNRTAVSDCALQIGIAGKRVLSAADTFTGETADYTNFSMEPLEVKSFKFTLEDEA